VNTEDSADTHQPSIGAILALWVSTSGSDWIVSLARAGMGAVFIDLASIWTSRSNLKRAGRGESIKAGMDSRRVMARSKPSGFKAFLSGDDEYIPPYTSP